MERLKTISALTVIFFIVIGAKIFQKQILEYKKYVELAKGQQIIKKEINAKRGRIYVQEGREQYPLGTNLVYYAVSVVPKHIQNKEEVARKLAPIINIKEADIFEKINNDKLYLPPIVHKLEENQADKIKELNLSGVYLQEEDIRCYPEGEAFAHILGFVDAEKEGKYGLEGFYNVELKGEKGTLIGEKDTKGRIINYLNEKNVNNGANLVLTIDRTIQVEAYKKIKEAVDKFKAKSGLILVMDPNSGGIIAMADYPSFDSNKYNEVKDYNVFLNPAIAKTWEPGSVFKVIAMAAGIDSGVVTKDTTEYFGASIKIGAEEIWNWDKKAHGKENMTQILETSDNIGMVYVAQKMGKDTFYKYLNSFGFGSILGIDLDKEITKELKEAKSWKDVELATMGFGQGIAVTPIQLVTAVSAIANGGKLVWPHIVSEMIAEDGRKEIMQKKEIRQVISPTTAQIVTDMMISVTENGHGKKARVDGYKVAGKTGTAQVPKQSGAGYEEGKTIGSFVGFAPAENPRFVMLVKLDEPQTVEWAESSAAPVFGELSSFILNYFQIAPNK